MTTTPADRIGYDTYGRLLAATGALATLDQLAAFTATAREIEDGTRARVWQARQDGATWQQIGDAIGVSKQAAQQRYGL